MPDIANRIVQLLKEMGQHDSHYIRENLEREKIKIAEALNVLEIRRDYAGVHEIYNAYLEAVAKMIQKNGDDTLARTRKAIEMTRYDLELLANAGDLYITWGDQAYQKALTDTKTDFSSMPVTMFYRDSMGGESLSV
jgi:predicted Rossmann fold nucleotide-binding protein DprA/Smf involved in DNA uptake